MDWRTVWRLSIPTKVSHFIWPCLHNALVVLASLYRRNIDVNPTFPLCWEGAETVDVVEINVDGALDIPNTNMGGFGLLQVIQLVTFLGLLWNLSKGPLLPGLLSFCGVLETASKWNYSQVIIMHCR